MCALPHISCLRFCFSVQCIFCGPHLSLTHNRFCMPYTICTSFVRELSQNRAASLYLCFFLEGTYLAILSWIMLSMSFILNTQVIRNAPVHCLVKAEGYHLYICSMFIHRTNFDQYSGGNEDAHWVHMPTCSWKRNPWFICVGEWGNGGTLRIFSFNLAILHVLRMILVSFESQWIMFWNP